MKSLLLVLQNIYKEITWEIFVLFEALYYNSDRVTKIVL